MTGVTSYQSVSMEKSGPQHCLLPGVLVPDGVPAQETVCRDWTLEG